MDVNTFFDGDKTLDLNNVIFIFGDVETTGLKANEHKITELALIKTDGDFNIISTYETFINPEQEITEQITKITGITEEMVADADKYTEAAPKVKEWWEQDTEGKHVIFVAHNAPFDIGFINAFSKSVLGEEIVKDWIDTVSIARELYPFWRNHKLDTCAKKFGIPNENHHRALNDTKVLLQVAKILIPEALESNLYPVNFRTQKKLHYKN